MATVQEVHEVLGERFIHPVDILPFIDDLPWVADHLDRHDDLPFTEDELPELADRYPGFVLMPQLPINIVRWFLLSDKFGWGIKCFKDWLRSEVECFRSVTFPANWHWVGINPMERSRKKTFQEQLEHARSKHQVIPYAADALIAATLLRELRGIDIGEGEVMRTASTFDWLAGETRRVLLRSCPKEGIGLRTGVSDNQRRRPVMATRRLP